MMKTNFNTIKKLKELGVSYYKDMSFEVAFTKEIEKPTIKKKEFKQDSTPINTVEDDILKITQNINIPLLQDTV